MFLEHGFVNLHHTKKVQDSAVINTEAKTIIFMLFPTFYGLSTSQMKRLAQFMNDLVSGIASDLNDDEELNFSQLAYFICIYIL